MNNRRLYDPNLISNLVSFRKRETSDLVETPSSQLNTQTENAERCELTLSQDIDDTEVKHFLDLFEKTFDLTESLHHAITQQSSITYEQIIEQVDRLLLVDIIMPENENNQSRAAKMLNINRGTLRKKLTKFGFFSNQESTTATPV